MPDNLDDVIHWVNGELLVKPDFKSQTDAETRKTQPHMTELQIQESWGAVECTLGIGVDTRLLAAGKAMLAALQVGDGRAALTHFKEASRLDPVAAEGFVRDTRRKLTSEQAAARWLFATRRAQDMLAALRAWDQQKALESQRLASSVEPGVAAEHLRVARRRGLL